MAAGGFRTFVAGETLDEDKINDFLMQGVLVFANATARDAAITAPVHGQFAFRKDDNALEFYDGTGWEPVAAALNEIDFLVVAGGGGGGNGRATNEAGGGGGGGGYRCSVSGEDTGGGLSAETTAFIADGVYPLIVGAGGASLTVGSLSIFGTVASAGGGQGGRRSGVGAEASGGAGGCGGGGTINSGNNVAGAGGTGVVGQGFAGGAGVLGTGNGGGGGGAGAVGQLASAGRNGGAGVTSSITGAAIARAGGGGGAAQSGGLAGGVDGGGNGAGAATGNGSSGTVNTGGGGGGSTDDGPGGQGGSGVIVFKASPSVSISFSAGVTHTTATVGTKTAYIVTAAGPTDTVTIG